MKSMKKLCVGEVLEKRELVTLSSEFVQIPDPEHIVHLQFRRFAGCPVCNLHLRSIARRHKEIVAAGIREVAVFHSSVESMFPYQGDLPFAVVADPEKRLYAEFGVESSLRTILDPRAWAAVLRGAITRRPKPPARGEGAFGLPADFLIASDGRVRACKYGVHADDQWSVDELLTLAQSRAAPDQGLAGRPHEASGFIHGPLEKGSSSLIPTASHDLTPSQDGSKHRRDRP